MSNDGDGTSIETGFDPAKHLTNLKGKDYLEVRWRLVWLRDRHPDAVIETDLIKADDASAIFRARVAIPSGGSATGYGSEEPGDFRDYIEKAETKALGRALAALGFGTQFCEDFDFGADQGRVVDSPVERRPRAQAPQRPQPTNMRSMPNRSGSPPPPPAEQFTMAHSGGRPMTDKQANFIRSLAKDRGWTIQAPDGSTHHDEEAIDRDCQQRFGKRFADLTTRDASTLIDKWQDEPLPADLELIAQQTDAALASRPGQPGNDRFTR